MYLPITGFQPSYEGVKQRTGLKIYEEEINGFQPSYEGLKLVLGKLVLVKLQ